MTLLFSNNQMGIDSKMEMKFETPLIKFQDELSLSTKLSEKEKESKIIFNFFQNFGTKISTSPNLLEKIKNPFEYNVVHDNYYGEVYSTDSFSSYFNNRDKKIDTKLYKKINFNSLNKNIFEEIFTQTSMPPFLELKINKYIYKTDDYLEYIINKKEKLSKGLLLIENKSCNFGDSFFAYDEIEMEITSVNDLLFESVSNIITSLSKGEENNASIRETILLLNSISMLDILQYFNMILNANLSMSENPLKLIYNENFYKVLFTRKGKKNIPKKFVNHTLSERDFALFNEIKQELEKKEKEMYKNIYEGVTHLYINNKSMKKEQINFVVNILNEGNCKMFAWYLSPEETKKLGVKNILKVGNIPSLENLTFYVIIH